MKLSKLHQETKPQKIFLTKLQPKQQVEKICLQKKEVCLKDLKIFFNIGKVHQ